MNKKLLATSLATALLASSFGAFAGAEELTSDAKFNVLKEAGVFTGYPDGSAGLDREMTRAEFATVLTRLFGLQSVTGEVSYADTAKHWASGNIEAVTNAGYMKGVGLGKFSPDTKVTIEQMATTLVRAFDIQVGDGSTVEGQVSDWAKAYVEAAVKAGLLEKKDNYTINAVRAILVDSSYVAKEKANVTNLTVKSAEATDEDTVEVTFSNDTKYTVELDTDLVEGKETEVKFTYNGKEFTTKVTYEKDYVKVTKDTVTVLNGKEVKVQFSKSVDEDSAENTSNYEFSNMSPAPSVAVSASKAELQEDGKTVILTLNEALGNTGAGSIASNQTTFDLQVSGVKDANGLEMQKLTVEDLKLFDTTLPVAEKVELVGPKTLEVTFSEPLHTAGTFSLDGGIYSATVNGFTKGDKVVKVQLGTTLSAGEHTLKAVDFKDYNGFKMSDAEMKFNYQTVSAFPGATVKEVDEKYVVLKFDAPVYNFSKDNFYHDYTGWKAEAIYLDGSDSAFGAGVVGEGAAAKEVKVVFANGSDPDYPLTGNNKVVMLGKVGSTEVKDLWSNKTSDKTFDVQASVDNVDPTVTSVKATEQDEIEVVFSEEVTSATAEDESNYTILDKDGDKLTNFTATYDNNNKTVTLKFDADLEAGRYDIKIKDIKDDALSANDMSEATFSVSISDLKGPDATLALVEGDKVLVQFADESNVSTSGTYSILNKENFLYDGDDLPSGVKLTIGSDNKSVIIDFTNTDVNPTTGKSLVVNRVADIHGNTSSWFSKTLTTALATTNAPKIVVEDGVSQARAVSTTTVEFDVDQIITGVTASDFQVNDVAPASATYKHNGDGTTTVSLTVSDANEWATGTAPKLEIIASNNMENQLGTALNPDNGTDDFTEAGNGAGITVEDKVAPEIAVYTSGVNEDENKVTTLDNDGDGKIDHIVVEYTEALLANSVSKFSYTVAGYTVEAAKVNTDGLVATGAGDGKYVVLTVTEKDSVDSEATPTVTQVLAVEDTNGNELGAQSGSEAIDTALPALVSTTLSSTDKVVTLTFSENISNALADSTALKAAVQLATDGSTFAGLGGSDTVTISGKTLVVTFNSALTGATNKVKVGIGAVKDVAGNATTAATTTAAIDVAAN